MPGVLVVVTDHAYERFCQRVASRRGELDRRAEISSRVSLSWEARRVSDKPPTSSAKRPAQRGVLYVHDLSDRDLIFVCAHDRNRGELIVITLWERDRLGTPRVPRRFTDALARRSTKAAPLRPPRAQ